MAATESVLQETSRKIDNFLQCPSVTCPQWERSCDGPVVAEEIEQVFRFARNGFSVGRLDRNQFIHSKDLTAHSNGAVGAAEFSDDGSLLISGGNGERVLIWNMEQVLGRSCNEPPTPIELKIEQDNALSLAVSQDNSRIFVGGLAKDIYIFDAFT